MPLRTDALNRGTQNLVNVDTHIEKGSKIAKGQENLTGLMSQFSSLMSVMEEDFSLMNDMQREYSAEKSEVLPDLPEELIQNIPERTSSVEDSIIHQEPILLNQGVLDIPNRDVVSPIAQLLEVPLIEDGLDLVTQEIVSPVIEVETNRVAVEDAVEIIPMQPLVPSVESVSIKPSPAPMIVEKNIIQIPTTIDLPEILANEILKNMNEILVETVVEDEVDTIDSIKQTALPQFIREGFRLLDEAEVQVEDIVEETGQRIIPELETVPKITDSDSEIVQVTKPTIHTDVISLAQTIGTVVATNSQINPVVTTSADGVSIQQTKNSGTNKLPKMPKLPQDPKFFNQSADEKQEVGTEKMSFSSKLIQRLEMIIMDPLGRLDVEVAQEMMGIQVKAIAPSEMLSSLAGMEQDLQVALDGHGIDLSSFELEERAEDSDSARSNNDVDKETAETNEELEEKLPMGGMLLSRRV